MAPPSQELEPPANPGRFNPFHQQVTVIADSDAAGDWRVEYFDDDGGCYVTLFAGPKAEKRARDYFEALKFGRLRAVRA
jgi:hypothetical protein